jgi:hypothetical protein
MRLAHLVVTAPGYEDIAEVFEGVEIIARREERGF